MKIQEKSMQISEKFYTTNPKKYRSLYMKALNGLSELYYEIGALDFFDSMYMTEAIKYKEVSIKICEHIQIILLNGCFIIVKS